jgi:very-short-patch-repair endonuclease
MNTNVLTQEELYNSIHEEFKKAFKYNSTLDKVQVRQPNKKLPEIQETKNKIIDLISWYNWDNCPSKILDRKKLYLFLNNIQEEDCYCMNPRCQEKVKVSREVNKLNEYCCSSCASKDEKVKEKQANTNNKNYGVSSPAKIPEVLEAQKKSREEFLKKEALKKQEEFIKKASIKHNNRYDYSKVQYKTASTKVIIICPEHGEFLQTPSNHLKGSQPCPECLKNNFSYTINQHLEIIKKNTNFLNKYSILNLENKNEVYTNFKEVYCNCSEHGEFKTNFARIKQGSGCPKCSKNYKLDNNKIIKNCKQVHKNKFKYNLDDTYKNTNTKLKIICPDHGEFLQLYSDHIRGHSCPKCSSSKGEKIIENFLRNYLDNSKDSFSTQYKFQEAPAPINNYRFDFYIPEVNLVIEFDGIQHFEPIDFAGKGSEWAKEEFLKNKKRDEEKNKYLLENNINLLRVPYTLSEYDIEICSKEEIRWLRQ